MTGSVERNDWHNRHRRGYWPDVSQRTSQSTLLIVRGWRCHLESVTGCSSMNATVSHTPSALWWCLLFWQTVMKSSSGLPGPMTARSTHSTNFKTTLEAAIIVDGNSVRTLHPAGTFTPRRWTLHERSACTTTLLATWRTPLGSLLSWQYSTVVESGKTFHWSGIRISVRSYCNSSTHAAHVLKRTVWMMPLASLRRIQLQRPKEMPFTTSSRFTCWR